MPRWILPTTCGALVLFGESLSLPPSPCGTSGHEACPCGLDFSQHGALRAIRRLIHDGWFLKSQCSRRPRGKLLDLVSEVPGSFPPHSTGDEQVTGWIPSREMPKTMNTRRLGLSRVFLED